MFADELKEPQPQRARHNKRCHLEPLGDLLALLTFVGFIKHCYHEVSHMWRNLFSKFILADCFVTLTKSYAMLGLTTESCL